MHLARVAVAAGGVTGSSPSAPGAGTADGPAVRGPVQSSRSGLARTDEGQRPMVMPQTDGPNPPPEAPPSGAADALGPDKPVAGAGPAPGGPQPVPEGGAA